MDFWTNLKLLSTSDISRVAVTLCCQIGQLCTIRYVVYMSSVVVEIELNQFKHLLAQSFCEIRAQPE